MEYKVYDINRFFMVVIMKWTCYESRVSRSRY